MSVNLIVVHDHQYTPAPPPAQAGGLYVWGITPNDSGELGLGNFNDSRDVPTRIGSANDWTFIHAPPSSAIRDGKLFTWGDGASYILGLGNTTDRNTPNQVGSGTNWSQVSLGIGLRDGELWSWGMLGYASGHGDEDTRTTPEKVDGFSDWEIVRSNGTASFGIRDGKLYSWGYNYSGITAQGTTSGATQNITQVGSDTGWEFIDTVGEQAAAIRNGELYRWGLGIGSTPQRLGSNSDWTSVRVGDGYQTGGSFYGIRDGKLFAWGDNSYGQLGIGSLTNQGSPQQVGSSTDWEWVGSLGYIGAGIRDGKLYTWGRQGNWQGRGEDGNDSLNTTPQQVGTDSDWRKVICAGEYCLAIKG